MDSGHNPTSPMPGNGPAPAVPPTPQPAPAQPTPQPTTPQPVAPQVPPVVPQAESVMNSRRTRSTRPASANNMPVVVPPVTSGEVVIDPQPIKKKSPINKGVLIGLIIAAVLIVAGIVALLVLPRGSSNNNLSQVREAFSKYAKFIIDGNEEGELNINSKPSEWALSDISVDTPQEQQEYSAKLQSYETQFSDTVSKNNFDGKEEILSKISDISTLINAYKIYATIVQSKEDIIRQYISDGYDEVLQTVKTQQEKSDNALANDMYSRAQTYLVSFLDLVKIAERNGCISNNVIDNTDNTCRDDGEFMKAYRKNSSDYSKMTNCAYSILLSVRSILSHIKYGVDND